MSECQETFLITCQACLPTSLCQTTQQLGRAAAQAGDVEQRTGKRRRGGPCWTIFVVL